MLSLFKESLVHFEIDLINRCRQVLVQYLNKGHIPDWNTILKDLPVIEDQTELWELEKYFQTITTWTFLKDIMGTEATEFFLHGPQSSQALLFDGQKSEISLPIKEEDWQLWLEIISIRFKQNWNVQNPFCSFYGELFGHNFRFSMIHASTGPLSRSKLILRRLSSHPHPIESFGRTELLIQGVQNKKTILIAGSTGSGKTSLLTGLLNFIKKDEHLVILEDTYEILSAHPHQTRLLAGASEEKSLKAYLAYSLRLSPDRIVLGEMRSHEVIPFIMAMNTGHKGLMGTIHASSAIDALNRVALLFSLYSGETSVSYDKVMELICRNLDHVVFMENKKVKEVIQVLGSEKGVPFYENLLDSLSGTTSLNLF